MGFYSVSPLTPGGWSSLLDDRGLPHNLRRLPVTHDTGYAPGVRYGRWVAHVPRR